MKWKDLKNILDHKTSYTEWTDSDTWKVLDRIRKEKAGAGSRRYMVRLLAVAAVFVLCFGLLAASGTLGLNGRPDPVIATADIPLAQGALITLPAPAETTATAAPAPTPADTEPSPTETVPAETGPDATSTAPAETAPAEKSLYRYTVQADGTAQITGADKDIVNAEIPAELDGHAVASIGEQAFFEHTALESVIIPEGVRTVGPNAFAGCYRLKTVTLPESMETLERAAFSNCYTLESINIPDRLTYIDYFVFSACTALQFRISPDHDVFAIRNNALVNRHDMTLHWYASDAAEDYKILSGVLRIAPDAFANRNITSVTIPNTVTEIGQGAFYGCRNLKSVTIPASVTSLGNQVFYECENLESLSIPDSVTFIGYGLFSWCNKLTSVQISPDNPVYEMNGPLLIDKITHRVLCCLGTAEGTCEIPYGITDIDEQAFHACKNLKEIIVPKTVNAVNMDAFGYNDSSLVVKAPAGSIVQEICEKNGIHFRELTPGETSPEVDPESASADGLYQYVKTPGNTIRITGVNRQQKEYDIPAELEGCPVTAIGDAVFQNIPDLVSVTIPEGVTEIRSCVFCNSTNLRSVNIPDSLVSLGTTPFLNCWSLDTITVSPDHPVYSFDGDILVDKRDMTLIRYANLKGFLPYEIPEGITRIAEDAFICCNRTAVTIPDSVTEIGSYVFTSCHNLKKVTIGNGVTSIGSQAFYLCSALQEINIPDSVRQIGDAAFNGCRKLTSVQVSPDHPVYEYRDLMLIDKGRQAIVSVSAAASGSLTVPEDIREIGNVAFQDCGGLTEIIVPGSVKVIGWAAFDACESAVIRGPEGSEAQRFCEKENIPFSAID